MWVRVFVCFFYFIVNPSNIVFHPLLQKSFSFFSFFWTKREKMIRLHTLLFASCVVFSFFVLGITTDVSIIPASGAQQGSLAPCDSIVYILVPSGGDYLEITLDSLPGLELFVADSR